VSHIEQTYINRNKTCRNFVSSAAYLEATRPLRPDGLDTIPRICITEGKVETLVSKRRKAMIPKLRLEKPWRHANAFQ
jgi:hypothetical protein